MSFKTYIVVWFALSLTFTCAAADEIYQWRDANGVTHFSDSPPTNQSNFVRFSDQRVGSTRSGGSGHRKRTRKPATEEQGRSPAGSRAINSAAQPAGVRSVPLHDGASIEYQGSYDRGTAVRTRRLEDALDDLDPDRRANENRKERRRWRPLRAHRPSKDSGGD